MDSDQPVNRLAGSSDSPRKVESDFSFQGGPSLSEDDDEVTESKIRAFLDDKVLIFIFYYDLLIEYNSTIMNLWFIYWAFLTLPHVLNAKLDLPPCFRNH